MEAVQAAKAQGWAAAEELDGGLRRAFWRDSRCISMRHVIRDVACRCPSVDLDRLMSDLDRGVARRALFEQFAEAKDGRVNCSPHVFLSDGTDAANPGVRVRWTNGRFRVGFPVVDDYDPTIYQQLIAHAASLAAGAG
jgi:predicted DsbA family dithiol-disulfide isomerase